jgi:hypothetical protein
MQDCFVKGVLNCCGADQPDLYKKIEENTWRVSDLWKVDGSKLDLLAVAQSMLCEVERMMGIFPNVDIKRNRHE